MAEFGNDDVILEYEYGDTDAASIELLTAICALENVDPRDAPQELGFRLYNHVDPEALNSLMVKSTTPEPVEVRFELNDYHVRIVDTGRIELYESGL